MKTKILQLLLIVLPCFLLISCGDSDTIIQSLMDISGAPLDYDDSKATKHLTIASVCLECSKEKQENIDKMVTMIHKIMMEKPDTRTIVFGETILGWYLNPDEPEAYQRRLAETIPGATTERIGALADSFDIYIVFGLGEIKGEKLYNSQVLLNPDGELEAVHRKSHLVKEDEQSGFAPYPRVDENVTVVTIDGIRAGMIICADVSSSWLTQKLIDQTIELVIHSLASSAPEFKIDAVARQFNAWAVFANRYGKEKDANYEGTCYIADPGGTIRVGGDGKERYEYYRIGVY
ncbi:carbon-nitrogen hydrolase family protein [candidate division KSB1 bacterium]|nr:carbon-nitrogen hydrolase family protein [candidate division KSB1 bacterium]